MKSLFIFFALSVLAYDSSEDACNIELVTTELKETDQIPLSNCKDVILLNNFSFWDYLYSGLMSYINPHQTSSKILVFIYDEELQLKGIEKIEKTYYCGAVKNRVWIKGIKMGYLFGCFQPIPDVPIKDTYWIDQKKSENLLRKIYPKESVKN